jgi:hypothetical protein
VLDGGLQFPGTGIEDFNVPRIRHVRRDCQVPSIGTQSNRISAPVFVFPYVMPGSTCPVLKESHSAVPRRIGKQSGPVLNIDRSIQPFGKLAFRQPELSLLASCLVALDERRDCQEPRAS